MSSISGAAAAAAAAPTSGACGLRLRRDHLPRYSYFRLARTNPITDVFLSRSYAPSSSSPRSLTSKQSESGHAHGHGELDKDPIRLWNRYVEWLYQHKQLGLFVDVSRIGFTEGFLRRMEAPMQRAFEAMRELEKGAIANPDEGRMVGHYWLRSPALAPNSFLREKIETTLERIIAFTNDVISAKIRPPSSPAGRFTQILSIGIGGSSLGPQFVAEALAPDNPPLMIRFIDNTDPAGIDHQIAQLGPELASTLVIVISKSGGTPETRNGLLEVQKAFRDAGLEFSKQGVAITQENSLLDNTARIEGWLARFPMFDWVGGRTSEMSAVGLLPAALQGIDIKEMLVGAAQMDEETRNTEIKENPAALLALCWYWASDGIGSKDMVVLPYKDSLLLLSRYLQQLVMESLGKEFDLDGNRGTRSALYANDRESITVTVQEVNPRAVGALVALYERAVGLYAYLININAYHQPGVEAGKKAAGEVLALQKRILLVLNEASCKDPVEPLTLDQIADRCHCPEEIEMIYKIIQHMAANDRALIAEGNCGSPRSIKVYLGECDVDDDMVRGTELNIINSCPFGSPRVMKPSTMD
uniref:Glucose-6-phosphate isomerase n=1 Tax=Leersia perrieri TaxID=77586 RepID=A0A0D9X8Y6_9ORYZ